MVEEANEILVCVACGTEDIELTAPVDILRRAGAICILAKVPSLDDTDKESLLITCANKTKIICDEHLSGVLENKYKCIIIPGGLGGAEACAKSEVLIKMLKKQKEEGRWIASICASPGLVLGVHGLLEGETATCYPGFEKHFKDISKIEQKVVVSNKIITSRGPGTAMLFGYEIIHQVLGDKEKAEQLKKGMMFL